MRTLFVTPSLAYGGTAKQLTLLATHLPKDWVDTRVCVLGEDGPFGKALRSAGVHVEYLSWTRPFDVRPLLSLRRLIREYRPDTVHAWGFAALRASSLVRGKTRLICSVPVLPQKQSGQPNRLDQWLLRQAESVIVSERGSVRTYAELMNPRTIHFVPPAVESCRPVAARRELCDSIDVPANARLLVGVGPLAPHKGFRDAIWALDILKYLYDDLFLVLVGDGPDRQRLEQFARSIQVHDRVRFAGIQPDVSDWLSIAEVVWVPSLKTGGTNVALESMAAGRPVVGARIPALAEIIVEGETGRFFRPGDKVGLARHTHAMLQDRGRAAQLGETGRRRVAACFSISAMIETYAELHAALRTPSYVRIAC